MCLLFLPTIFPPAFLAGIQGTHLLISCVNLESKNICKQRAYLLSKDFWNLATKIVYSGALQAAANGNRQSSQSLDQYQESLNLPWVESVDANYIVKQKVNLLSLPEQTLSQEPHQLESAAISYNQPVEPAFAPQGFELCRSTCIRSVSFEGDGRGCFLIWFWVLLLLALLVCLF